MAPRGRRQTAACHDLSQSLLCVGLPPPQLTQQAHAAACPAATMTTFQSCDAQHEEVKACIEEYEAVGIWESELSAAGEPVVTFVEACRPFSQSD